MATTNKRFVAKNGLDNNNQTITNLGASGNSLGLSGTGDLTIAISGTATLTLPAGNDTLVTLTGSQNLTNKTLTSPIISSISNTGILTLPTSTDTLVGRATSDTLTNKTISGSNNTLSNIGNGSLTNSSVSYNGVSVALGASGTLYTDDISEDGTPVNLWFTNSRARAAISVTDSGGDGSLSYDNGTGVITYTGPSATEVRAHLSAGTGLTYTSGQFAIDSTVATLTGTQVLTNKTISGADNTLSNIGNSSLTNSSITINGTATSLGGTRTLVTDDIAEDGSPINLWYTDTRSRAAISVTDSGGDGSLSYNSGTGTITYTGPSAAEVRAHFTAGTGVAISSGQISIGQAVATTDNVTFAGVTADNVRIGVTAAGEIDTSAGNLTIDSTGGTTVMDDDVNVTGNMTIDGNLTVSGTTVTINATNLAVEDNMIYLNSGSTVTHPDLGFAGNYNDGTYRHAGLFRDESDGRWKFFHQYTPEPDASAYIDITHASFALAPVQASSFIGSVTGNVTGNASTATAWQTARTLTLSGDVTGTSAAFDGSGNISITTTIAADSVALGTDTTGDYVASVAVAGTGLSVSGSGENATYTITSNATSANTASAIVARDASGNFTAGTITAALSGNATTATTLQTARNINGVSFNGSADITVTAAAGTLSGNTLASGVTASSLTSVGTLTGLTVSGAVTSTLTSGIVFTNTSGGTNATQFRLNNTGGDMRIGIESSAGQTIQTGTSAYAAVFGNQANYPTQFTTNGTTRMTIGASGSVGIGTTSPGLSVASAGMEIVNDSYIQFKLRSTGASAGMEFYPVSGSRWEIQANTSSQWFVYDRTAEQYRLLINSSGNVGIGITSPISKLDLRGSHTGGYGILNIVSADNSLISIDSSSVYDTGLRLKYQTADKWLVGIRGSDSFTFANASDARILTITQTGYVGINTTSPGRALTIASGEIGLTQGYGITWNSGDNYIKGVAGYALQFTTYDGGSSQNEVMRLTGGTIGAGGGATALFGTTVASTTGGFTNTRMVIKQIADGGTGGGLHIEQNSNTNVAYFGFTGSSFRIGTSYRSTGSYQPIDFYTGPTTASSMILSTSGNLGIGTSSPGVTLDVNGTIRTRNGAFQLNDGSSTGGGLYFYKTITGSGTSLSPSLFAETGFPLHFMTNGSITTRLYVGTDGNVGIGTTSPTSLLNVNGSGVAGTTSASGAAIITVGALNNYPSLELAIGSTYNAQVRTYGNDLQLFAGHWRTIGNVSSEDHSMFFYTSQAGSANWSTAKMTLNHNGDVVIGRTNINGNRLMVAGAHVGGRANLGIQTTDNGANLLGFFNASDIRIGYVNAENGSAFAINAEQAVPMIFYTNSAERMRINGSNAWVGIGVSNPDCALSVNGVVHVGNGGNALYMGGTAGSISSWGSRHITSSGNHTISLNTFRVDNAGYGSTWSVEFTSSGITASGNITAYSDVRIKENIFTIENALDKVTQLRGVYFNRISDETKTRQIGVIAQEILDVIPEVVQHSNDTYSVAYGNITALLIEAIKELKKENELLTIRINNITGETP